MYNVNDMSMNNQISNKTIMNRKMEKNHNIYEKLWPYDAFKSSILTMSLVWSNPSK